MTLPRERIYAINNTREFLYALLDRKQTPKVPLAIRKWARNVVKHFPNPIDMRIEEEHGLSPVFCFEMHYRGPGRLNKLIFAIKYAYKAFKYAIK